MQAQIGIQDNLMPAITPPSPQAHAFIRYGEIPVSNYTGQSSVSIPLYTIQLKDINIPIALSYDGSGVKVDAEAGCTGLGWILDTGGVITQTMMGRYNDFYSSNIYFDSDLPDIIGLYPSYSPWAVTNYCVSGFPFYGASSAKVWAAFLGQFEDVGERDFAPDVFHYRFQGYSGKFIFRRDGTILKEREDDVKFEPTITGAWPKLTSWKATTPDGTQYFFRTTETTRIETSPMQEFNSSWYLSRIETVSGTVIDFEYGTAPQALRVYSRRESPGMQQRIDVTSRTYTQTYLKRISYPGGSVELDYASDRKDLAYAPKLTTLHVKNIASNPFRWNFLYDYFTANDTTNEIPTLAALQKVVSNSYYTTDWNTKRLKLTGLTCDQPASSPAARYSFGYNETHLPTKLSAAIDHWGYYNGANNYSLIPTVVQNTSQTADIVLDKQGGSANREANGTLNQAFMLNRIAYPTGGSTLLTYEPNKYLISNTENDPYKKDYWYIANTVQLVEGPGYNNVPGDAIHTLAPPFVIASGLTGVTVNVAFQVDLADNYAYSKVDDHNFYLSLESVGGTVLWKYHLKDPELPSASALNESNRTIRQRKMNIPIGPGSYVLKITGPLRTYIKTTTLTASYNSVQDHTGLNNVGIGGGVRVRSVQSFDTDGTLLKQKKYIYTSDGSENEVHSSGKLMFYPRYRVDHNRLASDGLRGGGPSVGYSCVFEIDMDASGNEVGKTSYTYINKPDRNLGYSWQHKRHNGEVIYASKDENPKGIDGFRHSENGLLLSKCVYRYPNPKVQTWTKGTETTYTYRFLGDGPNIVWGMLKNPKYLSNTPVNSCKGVEGLLMIHGEYGQCMGYLYPALRPMQPYLTEKKETYYHDGPWVIRTTKYTYTDKHCNVATESVSTSDGRELITHYKYPFQFTDNTMGTLTAANRIATPVETVVTLGNTTVSKRIDRYASFDGKVRLSSVQTATGPNGTLETRVSYHKYDRFGNPVHVRKDNTDMVYIWSYQGQYPIAEISNCAYNAAVDNALVQVYGFTADNLTGQTTPPAPRAGQSLQQHATFQQALVTTYTYLPLVGVTSVTDPSMRKMYYDYDSYGRLIQIRDEKGNPVNKYTYKLKN